MLTTVDNFQILQPFLEFSEEEDYFYFLQIVKRKKENPDQTKNAKALKTYYVSSLKKFNAIEEEVKLLCQLHNARAYLNLNRRSFERIAFQTLKKITDCILNKDFRGVAHAYNSVCGTFSAEINKKWIIDVDADFTETLIVGNQIGDANIYGYIPTINGFHIITCPFNLLELEQFKINHPFDVHKNNPTLLFYTH
jgi:hypothetical protein